MSPYVWQRARVFSSLFLCTWQEGDRAAVRRESKERPPVCYHLLRFGNGRFDSSTPISLLWHSSPLNRIDYWFCSLRLLSFPSDYLFSKGAEEKHCVLPTHNVSSHLQNRDCNIKSVCHCCSREDEEYLGADTEISPNSLCGVLIWKKKQVYCKMHVMFLYWSHVRENTRWAYLIVGRGGMQKKLSVRHQAWILSRDITSPCPPQPSLFMRSRIDLLVIFHCAPVLTGYFVISVWLVLTKLLWSVKWIICQCVLLCCDNHVTIAKRRFTD